MQFSQRKKRQAPAVIIISLIDILIVLLIFLMVTTTFKQVPAVKIRLPEAAKDESKTGATQNANTLIVTVAKVAPHFYLNTKPITLSRLQEEFTRRGNQNTNSTVAIRSDEGAPFGEVLNVIKAANAAKIKSQISVFVRPPDK